jgi:WhiB family redox-sensing transcriptional regulator
MPNRQLFTEGYWQLLRVIQAAGRVPCADQPGIFYPEDFPDPIVRKQATRTAKALCRECPVMSECLTFALESNERFGVWGGLSASERSI